MLYYIDPMNPAYKSEKPGIAPCGMSLEPVYADDNNSPANGIKSSPPLPAGTIAISSEKQQLIGVKLMTVEKAPWSYTLRVLGRVTPDETRIYRINAATNGWIMDALPLTTGSMVKKDDLLATFSFFSAEFRSTLQAYLNIVNAGNTNPSTPEPAGGNKIGKMKDVRSKEYESIRLTGRSDLYSQGDYYKQNITNYGITETQLKEIERSRKIPDAIDIRSPASGFLLFRNVSPGLRFDRGTELFRVVDLTKVWILADVFENEISFFKPGMSVKMELPYQKKIFYARLSNVLPQFDQASRTIKLRLEADNPRYVLRPDMFVNVELPLAGPSAIIVPADAIVDSGLKKTVFVDRGNGYFEPRQVETGRLLGERVEVTRGLMPGEKIVVAGNFLIDSESRMQQAAAGITGKSGRDSVCGMNIDEGSAKAAGYVKEYQGREYFFCSPQCRDEFIKAPQRYLSSTAGQVIVPSLRPKVNAAIDHSAHSAGTMTEPHGGKAQPHNHKDMKTKMPGAMEQATEHSSGANGISAAQKKEGNSMPGMPAPVFDNSPRMAPIMPGASNDKLNTGAPGFAPNMPQSPQDKRSDAFNPGMKKEPGQEGFTVMPGLAPVLLPPEQPSSRAGRTTSRPPRKGAAPSDYDATMPGEKANSPLSVPNNIPMIPPSPQPGQ